MADETDAEKIARLELECEELTEELHMVRKAAEELVTLLQTKFTVTRRG